MMSRQELRQKRGLTFSIHAQNERQEFWQTRQINRQRTARAMNAYMRASNLAHIPEQIEWNSAKRGIQATKVKSAYSSQECGVCHYVDEANRPDQQTFCCQVCHFQTHADVNAATNVQHRLGDSELRACKDRKAVKALLMRRHQAWKQVQGWP